MMQTTILNEQTGSHYVLTQHACERMCQRGLSPAIVQAALEYGRIVHARGAEIHVIGRKEIELYDSEGINLSPLEGVQVVCDKDGTVLTTYRNRDFRGLRPRRRSRRDRY